jgi:hypothetical protein
VFIKFQRPLRSRQGARRVVSPFHFLLILQKTWRTGRPESENDSPSGNSLILASISGPQIPPIVQNSSGSDCGFAFVGLSPTNAKKYSLSVLCGSAVNKN